MDATVWVLYGTQTGWARDVSEHVARMLRRRDILVRVRNLSEMDPTTLAALSTVVFVISTTGQGDVPDSAQPFWRYLLRRELSREWLSGLGYALFGLGDSSYTLFNAAARKLDRRLGQLGASALCARGEGDDQHRLGLHGALEPWALALAAALDARLGLAPGRPLAPADSLTAPRYRLVRVASDASENSENKTDPRWGPLAHAPFAACVLANERLTADAHTQDVRRLVFDISSWASSYAPGDVAVVQPENAASTVDAMLARCGLDGALVVRVEPVDGDVTSLPPALRGGVAMPVRELFSRVFDLTASPRPFFFWLLSFFTPSELELERLRELASPSGLEGLYDYCLRDRRTVLEVLQDFPASSPPLERLLEMLPALMPRAYSISSSQRATPGELEITVAVVRYQTRIREPRVGLCSSWLGQLERGAIVPLVIQRGTLRFAPPPTPLIVVGPGTGIAPFRALALERAALGALSAARLTVLCGHRSERADFLYGEDWQRLASAGTLTLWTAFSRDTGTKVYVQHLIRAHSAELWALLNSPDAPASIYVAGSAKAMPAAVRVAFRAVVAEHAGVDEAAAEEMLRALDRCGRYQCETWS